MKVWALEMRSKLYPGYYWTGEGLMFSMSLDAAVLFVRSVDASRVLHGNPVLNAEPVEMTWPVPLPPVPSIERLPDGDEPRTQSAAGHHDDGGAANVKREA